MRGRKRVSIDIVSIEDLDPVFEQDRDFGVLQHSHPDDNAWRERMALERHWREEEFPLSPFPWGRKLDIEDIERRERELDRDLLPGHLR